MGKTWCFWKSWQVTALRRASYLRGFMSYCFWGSGKPIKGSAWGVDGGLRTALRFTSKMGGPLYPLGDWC